MKIHTLIKILVPSIALILAVTLPVAFVGSGTQIQSVQHHQYSATVPAVADYGNPASLTWADVEPVTDVEVNEITGAIESVETKDVGQLIADFGIYLAETYGNGAGGITNKFRYDNTGNGVFSAAHGYNTYGSAQEHLSELASGELDYMNFSCAAFASFCQKKILGDLVYYDLGCSRQGLIHYADVVCGNDVFWPDPAAFDFIKENARPGDILLYTDKDNKVPLSTMTYADGGFVHAELYVGQYRDWAHACVGSNMPGRDVSIKPLEDTLYSSHTRVYLIPLAEWLSLNGYEVVADTEISFEDLAKEVF